MIREILSEVLDVICTIGMLCALLGIMAACEQPGYGKMFLWLAIFVVFAMPVIIKSARGDYQS